MISINYVSEGNLQLKDGPSVGIAIIQPYSLKCIYRCSTNNIAMTGEITLSRLWVKKNFCCKVREAQEVIILPENKKI